MHYIGRFAPSPTGPLHLGSLLTAVASFLHARQQGGHWHLRIDDLDPPREQPGSREHIIQALSSHGLYWDGEIQLQSLNGSAYQAAIDQLAAQHQLFWCRCSRKMLQGFSQYPGHCYSLGPGADSAIRVRHGQPQELQDDLQGRQYWAAEETADFIIKRRDGFYAYHLASVVDDAALGVSHIIRGVDLLSSTGPHLRLQQALGLAQPQYAHLPVILASDGQKLSKQTGAQALALDPTSVSNNLAKVLQLLVPDSRFDSRARPQELLAQGLEQFKLARLAGLTELTL